MDILSSLTLTIVLFHESGEVKVKTEPTDSSPTADSEDLELPNLPLEPQGFPQQGGQDQNKVPVKADISKLQHSSVADMQLEKIWKDCVLGSPENQKNETALETVFGDVFVTQIEPAKNIQQLVETEMSAYKNEPVEILSGNPLLWWKTHQGSYHCLAKMAKSYLGIPVTSVPSGRVFFTAGDTVTAQRSALSAHHVDTLIFLKKNMNMAKDM